MHVGGVQGIAGRNAKRYFPAIEAFLDTLGQDERRDRGASTARSNTTRRSFTRPRWANTSN